MMFLTASAGTARISRSADSQALIRFHSDFSMAPNLSACLVASLLLSSPTELPIGTEAVAHAARQAAQQHVRHTMPQPDARQRFTHVVQQRCLQQRLVVRLVHAQLIKEVEAVALVADDHPGKQRSLRW